MGSGEYRDSWGKTEREDDAREWPRAKFTVHESAARLPSARIANALRAGDGPGFVRCPAGFIRFARIGQGPRKYDDSAECVSIQLYNLGAHAPEGFEKLKFVIVIY